MSALLGNLFCGGCLEQLFCVSSELGENRWVYIYTKGTLWVKDTNHSKRILHVRELLVPFCAGTTSA
jgi:hypothetical protein